jgi:3-hydroxyacyl-CoA dehydrogenase/enoyl-CoA hydratase/3-hydroxybutyryl-CoA epimerase
VAEGIVGERDADVGSLLGWGFPAVLGGALGQIDTVGAARFVAACDRLALAQPQRYAVPQALRELANSGGRYRSTQ